MPSFPCRSRSLENARQLPIHNHTIDAHDKMEPGTNSPAQAGLRHLTHHFNQPKSKPKVSGSKTLRNKPREGGGPMTETTKLTPSLTFALLLALIPAALQAEPKIFFANDYGAKGDGVHFDGVAIQEAIHVAATAGGTLTFKPGTYLTGSLFLE